MKILRLRNPPQIADPRQNPGVFSGMNEPGEALHVERVLMTGSEKGCSHVYSHERLTEVARCIVRRFEGHSTDAISGCVLAAGEVMERLLQPLSLLPHWTSGP